MDGHFFDDLTRLVGSRVSRRASLGLLVAVSVLGYEPSSSIAADKRKKKISICFQGQRRKVKKKGWRKRYDGATQGPNCGAGCCTADTCFAETVNPENGEPTSFGCCPATQVCRSTKPPFPDQCCYPDETCNPALADNPEAETICCRPCNGLCCLKVNDECINGVCTPVDTARLPRGRRP